MSGGWNINIHLGADRSTLSTHSHSTCGVCHRVRRLRSDTTVEERIAKKVSMELEKNGNRGIILRLSLWHDIEQPANLVFGYHMN